MSITSANAIYTITIASLYNAPQQLKQFSADEIFGTDPLEAAEVVMGIDGYLTGGFVFVPVKQHVTLMADSESNEIFDNWWQSQQKIKDLYIADGLITLPSLNKKWTMTRGILTTYPAIPDAAKTLRPRRYSITWQVPSPAPI